MSGFLPEDDTLPAHSLLGASGAHRWLNCPGSFALCRQAPSRPPSIYAAAGTLAHRYIEGMIMPDLKRRWQLSGSTVGTHAHVDGHVIEIDQDFIDGINVMLAYVWDRVQSCDGTFSVEVQVRLDPYFKRAGVKPPVRVYGRVDFAMIDEGQHLLEIVDFKNGSGVLVDPENNPQMLFYAAGVLAELAAQQPAQRIDAVRLTVVQPHTRGQDKIRSWDCDALDVLDWVDTTLIPGVQACAKPDAPLVPGSYCRFCSASFACPALIDKANEMAKHAFTDDPLSTLPSSPDKLAEALDLAAEAEIWINAVREYALEQLKSQVRIPGWSLVPTRPTRRWRNAAEAELLVGTLGLPKDAWRVELISPAQMEKLVRRHGFNWDKFTPEIESVSSGVKLARSTAEPSDFPEF